VDSNHRHGAYETKKPKFRKGFILGLVSRSVLKINPLKPFQLPFKYQGEYSLLIELGTSLSVHRICRVTSPEAISS
jgi:hypothetical protein